MARAFLMVVILVARGADSLERVACSQPVHKGQRHTPGVCLARAQQVVVGGSLFYIPARTAATSTRLLAHPFAPEQYPSMQQQLTNASR